MGEMEASEGSLDTGGSKDRFLCTPAGRERRPVSRTHNAMENPAMEKALSSQLTNRAMAVPVPTTFQLMSLDIQEACHNHEHKWGETKNKACNDLTSTATREKRRLEKRT